MKYYAHTAPGGETTWQRLDLPVRESGSKWPRTDCPRATKKKGGRAESLGNRTISIRQTSFNGAARPPVLILLDGRGLLGLDTMTTVDRI